MVTKASGKAFPTAIIVIPKYDDGMLVIDPKKVKLSIKTPENKYVRNKEEITVITLMKVTKWWGS